MDDMLNVGATATTWELEQEIAQQYRSRVLSTILSTGVHDPSPSVVHLCVCYDLDVTQSNTIRESHMNVVGIAFTSYPVTDLTRARQFYEGVLGLTEARFFGKEDTGFVEY